MVRARLGLKLLLIILILTLLSLLALGAREEVIRARQGAVTKVEFEVKDPDGDCPVTCTITNRDRRGLVIPLRVTLLKGCQNWQPLKVVYLPLGSCYGDTITVTCTDALGATGSGEADVAVNCPPVITIASEFPTHWRSDLIIPLTATDKDYDPITWSIERFPSYGAVEFSGDTVIYHPEPYVGKESWEDSFTVIADDGFGGRARATMRVQIVDKKPQASGLSTSTDEDSPLGITLPGSDPDNDPLQ